MIIKIIAAFTKGGSRNKQKKRENYKKEGGGAEGNKITIIKQIVQINASRRKVKVTLSSS